jgi:predicted MPP superfamily phosphohydrolase
MSLDPVWLIVVPILLGHVGLFVVFTNVSHALGAADRWMDLLKLLFLGAIVTISGMIVVSAAEGPWSTWPWLLRGYSTVCLATAMVGWPLSTIIRNFRRLPEGISGGVSEIDLAGDEGREAFIGPGKHAWMLRLPFNESFRLKKTEWEIAIPNLPDEWDGLSLLHLTDFHFAPCFRRNYFEALVDEAGGWDADLVAFTGDLVDNDAMHDWIVPVMSRLRGRLGTFAILGNHDYTHHPHLVSQALAHSGFTDLEGRWTRLEIEGATLAIGGTSFPWGPQLDPQSMPEADFRLLLSHTPDRFARAARWGVDLVLAGHNHAGQVRLPLIGPVFMPSVYSRRYDRGFFRSGRTLMYVSQGVAGKHPIRYGGCLPEVTRLVLRVARPTTSLGSRGRTQHADQALDSLSYGSGS